MTATLLHRMQTKPRKISGPPKSPDELAPPPIRRTCGWKKDGYVALPLRDILILLNYKIRYTEDEFRFHDATTGAFLFAATRSQDCRTPWDAIHAHGDFENPDFDAIATNYARTAPVKS